MKLRKHKNTHSFTISWTVTGPSRTETHVDENGKSRKVAVEGVLSPRQTVVTTGSDPTSVLNAFLFGRDRTAIVAHVIRNFLTAADLYTKRGTKSPASLVYYRGNIDLSTLGVAR